MLTEKRFRYGRRCWTDPTSGSTGHSCYAQIWTNANINPYSCNHQNWTMPTIVATKPLLANSIHRSVSLFHIDCNCGRKICRSCFVNCQQQRVWSVCDPVKSIFQTLIFHSISFEWQFYGRITMYFNLWMLSPEREIIPSLYEVSCICHTLLRY